jgi:hypothetical protein
VAIGDAAVPQCLHASRPCYHLTLVQKRNEKLHEKKRAIIRRQATRREAIINNSLFPSMRQNRYWEKQQSLGLTGKRFIACLFEDRRRETTRALSIICAGVI